MKSVFAVLITLSLPYVISGQEIEVKGIYAVSSFKKYQSEFGFGLGYNEFFNPKNRFGASMEYSMNCTSYEDN